MPAGSTKLLRLARRGGRLLRLRAAVRGWLHQRVPPSRRRPSPSLSHRVRSNRVERLRGVRSPALVRAHVRDDRQQPRSDGWRADGRRSQRRRTDRTWRGRRRRPRGTRRPVGKIARTRQTAAARRPVTRLGHLLRRQRPRGSTAARSRRASTSGRRRETRTRLAPWRRRRGRGQRRGGAGARSHRTARAGPSHNA